MNKNNYSYTNNITDSYLRCNSMPKGPNLFSKEIKMHLGLDLQGGVQLIYEIQTDGLGEKTPQQAKKKP